MCARADRESLGVSRTAPLSVARCLGPLARCAAEMVWKWCTMAGIYSSYTPAEGTVRYTVRSLQPAGTVQPGAQVSASALVLRLRQQRAARAAAREAPDALERKTVALDGDHVQRARAVRLVRVRVRVMARVRAWEQACIAPGLG